MRRRPSSGPDAITSETTLDRDPGLERRDHRWILPDQMIEDSYDLVVSRLQLSWGRAVGWSTDAHDDLMRTERCV
jgi:hypothetical protein